MKTRLAGIAVIAIGALFAVLFIYLPLRDGWSGPVGPVRLAVLGWAPPLYRTRASMRFNAESAEMPSFAEKSET